MLYNPVCGNVFVTVTLTFLDCCNMKTMSYVFSREITTEVE